MMGIRRAATYRSHLLRDREPEDLTGPCQGSGHVDGRYPDVPLWAYSEVIGTKNEESPC